MVDVQTALSMIRTGIEWLKSTVKARYYVINIKELMAIVNRYLPNVSNIPIDLRFQYTDFETMKKIIEIDWTNLKGYKEDVFDCDNFAFTFASRMAEIWEINGVAVAFGVIYEKSLPIPHFWNYFVARTENGEKLYFLEPQNDFVTEAGKESNINGTRYVPYLLLWY